MSRKKRLKSNLQLPSFKRDFRCASTPKDRDLRYVPTSYGECVRFYGSKDYDRHCTFELINN